jgi:ribonuclease-3 family protein
MEKGLDYYSLITDYFNIEKKDLCSYSPLTLAYIGDGIYELVIRSMLVSEGNEQVNKLHKKSSALVKAETQSIIIKAVMDELSEEELKIYKRGRNAKSFTSAKNASMMDYRMATGFEALIGYLYISGETDRMMKIIKMGLTKIGETK